MKKNVLVLANSNFFTVYSNLFLHRNFTCHTLNVRYPNEEMDRSEHLINQLKEHYQDTHYRKGLSVHRYSFSFTERIPYRISQQLKTFHPKIIILEMKTFDESELKLLHYLRTHWNIPIVVFISKKHHSKELMFQLAAQGVREVITQYDEKLFLNAILRNIS